MERQQYNQESGYCKIVVLLMNCCPVVKRKVLLKYVNDAGHTLEQFLRTNKHAILNHVGSWNKSVLFPPLQGQKTDIERWDISLLCVILSDVCQLPDAQLKNDITSLRLLRNEMCHPISAELSEASYNAYINRIKVVIAQALAYVGNDEFTTQIRNDITEIESGMFVRGSTVHQTTVEQLVERMHSWNDLEKEIIQRLDGISSEMVSLHGKVDEALEKLNTMGKRVDLPNCKLKLLAQIDDEKKQTFITEKLMGHFLDNVEGLREQIGNAEMDAICDAVDGAVTRLDEDGYILHDVSEGCISLTIRPATWSAMLKLFDKCVSGEMTEVFQPIEHAIRNLEGYEDYRQELILTKPDYEDVMNTLAQQTLDNVNEALHDGCLKQTSNSDETPPENANQTLETNSGLLVQNYTPDEANKLGKVAVDHFDSLLQKQKVSEKLDNEVLVKLHNAVGDAFKTLLEEKTVTCPPVDPGRLSFARRLSVDEPRAGHRLTFGMSPLKVVKRMASTFKTLTSRKRCAPKVALKLRSELNATTIQEKHIKCYISGFCIMSDKYILAVDNHNKTAKLIDKANDSDNGVVSLMRTRGDPWDTTAVTETKAAVTLPWKNTIQYFTVSDCGKLEDNGIIKVTGNCRGIVYHEGSLIVSFVENDITIQMLTLDGTVIKTLPSNDAEQGLFRSPSYLAVSPDGKKLFVSDYCSVTITEMDMSGHVMSMTDSGKYARSLGGVAIDNDGIVYVSDWSSDTLYCMDLETKIVTELLRKRDGLRSPVGAVYNKAENRLYVGMYNKILSFDIKKNMAGI